MGRRRGSQALGKRRAHTSKDKRQYATEALQSPQGSKKGCTAAAAATCWLDWRRPSWPQVAGRQAGNRGSMPSCVSQLSTQWVIRRRLETLSHLMAVPHAAAWLPVRSSVSQAGRQLSSAAVLPEWGWHHPIPRSGAALRCFRRCPGAPRALRCSDAALLPPAPTQCLLSALLALRHVVAHLALQLVDAGHRHECIHCATNKHNEAQQHNTFSDRTMSSAIHANQHSLKAMVKPV